jgi:zinc transport system substrate-binding protein
LEKPLTHLNKRVTTLNLLQSPDLILLNIRTGELWEHHDHKDKEVITHNEHSHRPVEESIDGHIWLNPDNAKIIVKTVATTLSQIDSEHTTIYRANADRLIQRLEEFSQTLRKQLIPIQDKPYLVFHDAYQYFENYYGLNAVGAITLSPEVPLSPKRLSEIRQKIKKHKVICVLSEPQFSPPVLATIVEGLAVQQGTLDPLGSRIPAGTESYFTLLQTLVTQLTECLSSSSIR